MGKLEDLKPNASVRGILPDSMVNVVNVVWYGTETLELTYKTVSGKVDNQLLYRDDEARIDPSGKKPLSFRFSNLASDK